MLFMPSTRSSGYASACSRPLATGRTSLSTNVLTAATSSSARAGSVGMPPNLRSADVHKRTAEVTQLFSQTGSEAPDFTLPDHNGEQWRLSAFRGRPVVLIFHRHL